jgi:hypothetical protein
MYLLKRFSTYVVVLVGNVWVWVLFFFLYPPVWVSAVKGRCSSVFAEEDLSCVCVYACACVYGCVYACMHVYVCMHACMHVHISAYSSNMYE